MHSIIGCDGKLIKQTTFAMGYVFRFLPWLQPLQSNFIYKPKMSIGYSFDLHLFPKWDYVFNPFAAISNESKRTLDIIITPSTSLKKGE